MLAFRLYSRFIASSHMLEKLVSYFLLDGTDAISVLDFKHVVLNYSGKSIYSSGGNSLILFLLYAFIIEQFSCSSASPTYAKNSISEFGIRCGQLMGFMVTLRGKRMYNFLFKYMHNGLYVEKGFDGLFINCDSFCQFGSLSFSIKNLLVFPEIEQFFESINEFFFHGQTYLNVNICFNTKSLLGMFIYFTHLKFPFNNKFYYSFSDFY